MQEVFLNLLPNGVPPVCYISQYDGTSRVIRFHLLNGTEPVTLNGSETITLNFRKPNREEVTLAIENTSSNYIDLVISSELSDKYGEGFGEFRIQGLGTLSFKMYIESDAYGDSLKTRSISGPIATFETDLAEDLIKLDVDLEPIQDLHGYDNPWPAGGGKNLLGNFYDWAAWSPTLAAYGDCPTSNSNRGLLLNTKPNTTYTISIELAPNLEQVPKYLYVASANGTDVSTRLAYITNGATLVSATFTFTTTATDIYYLRVNTSYINSQATFDTEIGNKVKWIQLEAGSTATSWSPYSNICPISGHDSAQLFRTGKNLYDKSVESIIGYITSSSFSTSSLKARSFYIPIVGGLTYTVQKMVSARFFIATSPYIPTNGAAFTNRTQNNARPSITITAGANDKYLWVFFYLYDTDTETESAVKDTIQIEVGSTATNYEPYISDPTPVTVQLGQTVYKGKLYSEQRKVLVTHAIFEKAVADMNNSEDYPGWRNSGIRNIVGSGVLGNFTTIGNIGIYYAVNTLGNNDIIYLAKTQYKMTQSEWKDNNLDLIVQFMIEVAEPFFIDLTQIQTASIDSTPVASFETTLAMPLNTSEHSFSCSQAEGTPTPDSPIPITGVSEITAYRTGKNLLPNKKRQRSEYSVHIGIENANDSIFLKAGTYVLNVVTNIDRAGTFLSGNNTAQRNLGNTYPLTFAIDHDDYFKLWVYKSDGITVDDITSFQLELGSSATEYEPYSGESITVSLGGTYYGGKLVQSEDGSRKIVLSHAQLVLSSANANIINRVNANKYRVFNADCGAKITGSDYADIKCNKMSSQTGTANDNRCYINSTGDIRMNFTSEYNTVADMIAAMESITVVYPLETPIEINLPDGDPLTTIAGENNVYCNTGNTALTYYYNMVADPIRIPVLVGTNNVYSDAGDVEVEYYTTLEGGND